MFSTDLTTRLLARLGFDAPPPPTLAGLETLFAAWCRQVPFDNTRKSIALHANDRRPLPGTDPVDFAEHWLQHGTGGTCWAGSTALHALLVSLGFPARRAVGSMRDLGAPNHGTVLVRLDDTDWLVDSSMLVGMPLPLTTGAFRSEHAFGVEIEPTDRGHVIWFDAPPHRELFPCRLLTYDVDGAFFVEAHERSRASSPFNQWLYARRNRDGCKIVLRGSTRFVRTAAGITEEALDRAALCAALRDDIGLSPAMVSAWARSGALDACYEPVVGPNTAPLTLLPPSRRSVA